MTLRKWLSGGIRLIGCLFGRHKRALDENGWPRCASCYIALSLFGYDVEEWLKNHFFKDHSVE